MRLLNARTIEVEDFSSKKIPPYAILSHTWGKGEVTLQDMERQTASSKAGYAKIENSCAQALRDCLDYIWVDTCCIDKTSSAELSEAINAMFRWYQDSAICYAFLSDVPSETDFKDGSPFAKSRWFTRGWTLQELLAPSKLDFYSNCWVLLGSKKDLRKYISPIAGIDETFLSGRPTREASIAARMSWAARRDTSREEDRSYSLLGLFDVHIPLLYGEGGKNAFFRLQEELIRKSDDQSIFAWYSLDGTTAPAFWDTQMNNRNSSVLADSPAQFRNCGNIVTCNPTEGLLPYVLSNVGIQMKLPIIFRYEGEYLERRAYAILWCRPESDYWNIVTVPVLIEGDRCGRAFSAIQLVNRRQALSHSFNYKLYLETRQDHHALIRSSLLQGTKASVFILRSLPPGYRVESVSPPEVWESWSTTSGRLTQWAYAPEELIPIIKITADGHIDVPIRTLRIAVRARKYENCHVVTVYGPSLPLRLNSWSVSENTLEWHFVPLNHGTGNPSTPSGVCIRLRKNSHFQYDIDTMDLRMCTYPPFWKKLATRCHDLSISKSVLGLVLYLALSTFPSLHMLMRLRFNARKTNQTESLGFGYSASSDDHGTSFDCEVPASLSLIVALTNSMFIVSLALQVMDQLLRVEPQPVVPYIGLSWVSTFTVRGCILVPAMMEAGREVFDASYIAAKGVDIVDLWTKVFYSLFWGLMLVRLFWNSWEHLIQKWCFPLFRVLISLGRTIGWVRRPTTSSRMTDPTLIYDL